MEITNTISECIRTRTPVSFSKYGDGEYACAKLFNGHNCDADFYTEKKKIALIESFKYVVETAPNAYMSYWSDELSPYWQSLTKTPVRWGKLHTLIFDDDSVQEKVELYTSKVALIQQMQQTKMVSKEWMYETILNMAKDE
jgi:hypothetical protein